MGAAGVIAVMITLALCCAASIHAAAGARSFGEAFGRIRSGPMQIFWLQCVIYALALKFSPVAGLVLFFLIAFVVPVGLCEDLGPNAAADRAWVLSSGYRIRILVVEVGAILVSLALMVVIGTLFLQANSPFVFLAPLFRAAISWILMAFLIAPFQFLFVSLTRLHQALIAGSEPVLHARAASNVKS
jgi:sterol desaturase/sphingolipid hydroxylase (fatty acid hydroxylase superfamily)